MFRNRCITMVLLSLLVLWAGPAFGSDRDQTIIVYGNGAAGPSLTPASVKLQPGPAGSETVTFLNSSGHDINVNNTATPPGQVDMDGASGRVVVDTGSTAYTFDCPEENGQWIFTIDYVESQGYPATARVCLDCFLLGCPAVSTWGIVVLVLLLLTAVTIVAGRRRRAVSG